MRSIITRGTARQALSPPISIIVASYLRGPIQTSSQRVSIYQPLPANQQSKWEVNNFETNLDAAIFGARVGPEGLSEVEAKKLLTGAPWYASSLRSDLNATEFLRKINIWTDSQTLEALVTQQRTLRKCEEILQLIFAGFEIEEHANVCSRGLTEFNEYIWKEVSLNMNSSTPLTSALAGFKIPQSVKMHLRESGPMTRKLDEDDDNNECGDPEDDARTVMDLLSGEIQSLSIDQERVQHALSEFKSQVENTVKAVSSAYGDAVLRTQSNPLVAGPSGLQPNTFGQYRPLNSLLESFSSSNNSWFSKDVTLPDATQLRVGKIPFYNFSPSSADGLFSTPITTVIPRVSKGWENQVTMMEYLGRPQDQLTALARVRSLKSVLERLQILSKKTLQGLSVSFKLATAISDVLRSSKWKSAKPHMRWMRACVLSKMAEIMRVSKNGDAMAKLMGSYISDPPPLDYEYLRLLKEARMRDRHSAPDIVYDWLTDVNKKGEALHPVIAQEDFVHDATLSISEARLQRAGLYDTTVVAGDVDHVVPPLYITAESLALVEDLTRNGAKIMTYEEMNAPDPKEPDVEIRYDNDKADSTKKILEDRISDKARFELIKKSGRLYETPIKGCLKKPKYML